MKQIREKYEVLGFFIEVNEEGGKEIDQFHLVLFLLKLGIVVGE